MMRSKAVFLSGIEVLVDAVEQGLVAAAQMPVTRSLLVRERRKILLPLRAWTRWARLLQHGCEDPYERAKAGYQDRVGHGGMKTLSRSAVSIGSSGSLLLNAADVMTTADASPTVTCFEYNIQDQLLSILFTFRQNRQLASRYRAVTPR